MAVRLRSVRDQVRELLNDVDPSDPVWAGPRLDQAIAGAYLALRALLPAHKLLTASAFTISASAQTFTLPATVTNWIGGDGGAEYRSDLTITLVSTGQQLIKLSNAEMDAMWNGVPATAQPLGIPRYFALSEGRDQGVNGRCYPASKASEACNLYAAIEADDLRNYVGSGGTSTLDDVEVEMSRVGVYALVLRSASDQVKKASAETCDKLGLDKAVWREWRKDSNTMLLAEAGRKHGLESSGRTQRWVN